MTRRPAALPPPVPLDAAAPSRDRVGPYRLLGLLGEGAAGRVFRATRLPAGPEVALKLARPGRPAVLAREAAALGVARHPAVVALLDQRLDGAAPYLVTERLEGAPLDALLRARGPLDVRAVADLMIPVCDALACLHAKGVVHRDLKPANLFVARGPHGDSLRVIDFSEARVPPHALTPSDPAPVDDDLGTPAYQAPEAREGRRADTPASDQYAFGVVLYECLSGRRPFPPAPLPVRVCAQVREDYVPLERAVPGLPAGVTAAVRRALRPSPADRFPTLWHLAAALLPFASEAVRATWRPALSVALHDNATTTALSRTLVRRVPRIEDPAPPTPPAPASPAQPSTPAPSAALDAARVRAQARLVLAAGALTALLVLLTSAVVARRAPRATASPLAASPPRSATYVRATASITTPKAVPTPASNPAPRPEAPIPSPRAPRRWSRPALPRSVAAPVPAPAPTAPPLPDAFPAASGDDPTLLSLLGAP